MKKIISLFTGLSLSYVSFTQLNLVWAKNVGGTSDVLGQSITTDAAGNVYTAGVFWETADFDSTSSLASAGNYDIFISKMDASGNFVWAKKMGGKSTDIALSIAVDNFGNVYTTGDFWGTADFDPGPGIFSLTSAGNYDVFISKLDASGNFVWAKNMGGPLFDVGYSIAVDGSGNVYAIGSFQDTADFDPGNGIYNLKSAGSEDIFIMKLNSSGNFVWAKNMGGSLSDVGHSIALDGLGNVYSTGWFYGTADFDPGGKIYNLTSAGDDDVFISKLDASGNFVWAKHMGGVFSAYGESIAIDRSGNVYTTGGFWATADFDPGPGTYNLTSAGGNDIFVAKLDASGNFLWAKNMGGASDEYGFSMAVDGSGNVYTTGRFYYTVDFDPGSDTTSLTPAGGADIFISILDASGNFVWAKNIGGPSGDYGSSIVVDACCNLYTTGYFMGTVDFDPGPDTYNFTSSSKGYYDTYIAKFRGIVTGVSGISTGVEQIKIYPNPISQFATILFSLPKFEKVSIQIFDVLGRFVATLADAEMPQGMHQFTWDASKNVVSPGIYFIRLIRDKQVVTKKVIVIG